MWSSVSHPNVLEVIAVIEGDWDAVYTGTRIYYQVMPRVTGEQSVLSWLVLECMQHCMGQCKQVWVSYKLDIHM